MALTQGGQKPKWLYYAALIFVVIFWGLATVLAYYLYRFYSAAALSAIMTLVAAIFFWALAGKKIKQIDRHYWKIALPIGIVNALANLLQKIGLQYTTPANCIFFEHISCIVVPIMMFLFIRKRPTILQALAGICCLAGCFILSGAGTSGLGAFNIGDVLCLSAGVLFGVYIAGVSAYTKELNVILFMVFQMTVYFLVSLLTAVGLHVIRVDGVPMEQIVITWDLPLMLLVIVLGLVSIALCWLLKTEAIRHIDPVKVATVSPFSAVVTGVVSVWVGIDALTPSLVIGGSIIFLSVAVPEIIEAASARKKAKSV